MAPGAATMHKKTGKQLMKNGSFTCSLGYVLGRFRFPRSVSVALPRVPPLTRAFTSRIAILRFGRASLLHVVCRVARSLDQVARGLLALSLVVPLPLVLGCSGASPLRAGTRQSALGSCATPRLQCYVCTSHGAMWLISALSTRARAVERPPGVALCGA